MSPMRAIVSSAAAVALLLGITSCSAEEPMPAPTTSPTPEQTFAVTGDGVLRIGTLLPLTGDLAAMGASQVAGVEAAVREINLAGGINGTPIEVFHRNSGDATTDGAVTGFASLVERGVDVVIGPASLELAALIEPAAAESGIPLISPSISIPASDDAPDDAPAAAPTLFGLVPSADAQAPALAAELAGDGAQRVALVHSGTPEAEAFAASLGAALEDEGSELAASSAVAESSTQLSAMVSAVTEARADAVVIATPLASDIAAIVEALVDEGLTGDALWFTTETALSYSGALPTGALEGARGLTVGTTVSTEFAAALAQTDPGLASTAFAREAYDAVVLAALAATVAGDDGGPAIGRTLPRVSAGGIRCESFGECLDVLTTETDIDFDGLSGPIDLTERGSASRGGFGVVVYGADNVPTTLVP